MKEWHESIGAAIESAAGGLPEGWIVRVEVERHGYDVKLIDPSGESHSFEAESMVDEIEQAVEIAIAKYK